MTIQAGGHGLWPESAPYALCLTHDVDRVRKHVYHYLHYALRSGRNGVVRQAHSLAQRLRGEEPYWNFQRIMDLEDSLGVRSTFLFLNERARGFGPKYWGRYDIHDSKVKESIRTLDAGGWEIGLHGSYHSYNDIELLRAEKQTLEEILGKPIRSVRQHYLNLLQPRTWEIQLEIGLEVDSTFGYTDRLWDEKDGILPYYTDNPGMLELPITAMDTIGLGRPEIRREAEATLGRIAAEGGLIVLDWHQRTYSPGEWEEAVALYVSTIERACSERAWIATMGQISQHWRKCQAPLVS